MQRPGCEKAPIRNRVLHQFRKVMHFTWCGWRYLEIFFFSFHLLVDRVKELEANEVQVTSTAHQDDQRKFGVHDQQKFVQHSIMLTNLHPNRFGQHLKYTHTHTIDASIFRRQLLALEFAEVGN